jgi:hypothetical protein
MPLNNAGAWNSIQLDVQMYIYMFFNPGIQARFTRQLQRWKAATATPLSRGHRMHELIRAADGHTCLSNRSKNDHHNTEDGIRYIS